MNQPFIYDIFLFLQVEPGFGGQKFMADMMPKVELIRERFPHMDIEVDGGVGPGNVEVVGKAGANMVVSGTAVVKSPSPKDAIAQLREGIVKYL